MQLRSTSTASEIVVYREKWGMLGLGFLLGLACILFGGGFFIAMADKAPTSLLFLAILCGTFVLAGMAILVRLPRQASQMFADNGMKVLVANASGITLSPNLGSEPTQFPWASIAEIVLAEKLRIVESDETSYHWGTVVVFLTDEALRSTSWFDRSKAGISRSGLGRPFLLGDFPRNQGESIAAALRRFAPNTVRVRFEVRAIFDKKSSADQYPDA